MDEEYNLSPGEVLIMQGDHVELVSGKERIRLNEVVLTNKNLILVNEVSAGIFTTQRLLKRCPLDDIICSESIPQAFLGKKKDMYVLQVAFEDEAVTLHFPINEKREAKRWASAIKYAVVGDIDSIDTEETPLPSEVNNLIDGVSGFVGAFVAEVSSVSSTASAAKKSSSEGTSSKGKSTGRKPGGKAVQSKPATKSKQVGSPCKKVPVRTAGKCTGCHAPLDGVRGDVVVCDYCGTKQTL